MITRSKTGIEKIIDFIVAIYGFIVKKLSTLLINIIEDAIIACPFYYFWNIIIPIYFIEYIPKQFHHIDFIHAMGFIFLLKIAADQIQQLTPKLFVK